MRLKTMPLSESAHLKVHGRTTGELSPLALFWSGSALELNVSGSELWVEVESDYSAYEPWISILINQVPISRMMVTSGRRWICIFRGMSEKVVKNVRIIRDVQAMSGDPECYLTVHGLKTDGELHPVEDKPMKIEFIGDSITSGEGAIGAKQEEDWISMWFSSVDNYAAMTAAALNAEYRIISQSGWGVLTSWDNNPHCNIPDYYSKICGVLTGERNAALGAGQENDFSAWQPDVVVINLGTNDGGAFNNPEWKDEVTEETHKQRMNADGTLHPEDVRAFEAAVIGFLSKLRKYNQNAQLVWTYGMLGNLMEPAIREALETYIAQTGDGKVSYVSLPDTTEATVGARWHPGKLSHEAAARALTEYIRKLQ